MHSEEGGIMSSLLSAIPLWGWGVGGAAVFCLLVRAGAAMAGSLAYRPGRLSAWPPADE